MYTVGIEHEFYILDSSNYELVNLDEIEMQKIFGSNVKSEAFCCQIEINTPVCENISQLEVQYQRILDHIHHQALTHGLLILKSSTPIQRFDFKNLSLLVTDRHNFLQKLHKKAYNFFICCSLQIHVKTLVLDRRYPLVNYLRPYLPIFLVLSNSSPFWQGELSGLQSFRSQILQAIPNTGLPPNFKSMADFDVYLSHLKNLDAIKTSKDLWWDLRVHPIYPTLECRICDSVNEPKDAIAIAALYQALVYQIEQSIIEGKIVQETHQSIDEQNKWSAARYGLSGNFIVPENGDILTYPQAILKLLKQLEKPMEILGTHHKIKDVLGILERGTSADAQLRIFEKHQSCKSVIDYLSRF